MDPMEGIHQPSRVDRQLHELLTSLGVEQEAPSAIDVCEPLAQERLQITTHYLHLLCPLPRRRLGVCEQVSAYLSLHHLGTVACVSQGNTEEGKGFLVFASPSPFQETDQKWLVQHLGVDAYCSTVSVHIDLA